MTEQEIKDAWARWMHRNDLSEDLDTVYLFATTKTVQRMLMPVTVPEVLAEAPRVLLHAGLIYLHELAQDDQGGARETALFENAIDEYSMARSVANNPTISPITYQTGDP